MPVIANENSRLSWLLCRALNRRNRVVDLIRRLTGMGPRGSLNPSLFAKFLRMMDDVAAASREEISLIGQIEDIEQKHRAMRIGKKLKHAVPSNQIRLPAPPAEPEPYAANRSGKLLKLMVLWYLFMRQKINQKKQGLTAD